MGETKVDEEAQEMLRMDDCEQRSIGVHNRITDLQWNGSYRSHFDDGSSTSTALIFGSDPRSGLPQHSAVTSDDQRQTPTRKRPGSWCNSRLALVVSLLAAALGLGLLLRQALSVGRDAEQEEPLNLAWNELWDMCAKGQNDKVSQIVSSHSRRLFELEAMINVPAEGGEDDECSPQTLSKLLLLSSLETTSAETLRTRYLLSVFFFGTNGDQWKISANWLSDNAVCSWHGIRCSDEGLVERIALPRNNLSGTLPTEILQLTSLRQFMLLANSIMGSIPTEISSLSNLEVLSIGDNTVSALGGTLPSQLGDLKRLEHLDIHSDTIEGTIPGEIFHNDNLKVLHLGLPRAAGEFPSEVSRATSLVDLSLQGQYQGTFPDVWSTLTSLRTFLLISNDVEVELSDEMFENNRGFRHIEIRTENAVGSLPIGLGSLNQLTNFVIAGSERLLTTIPTEIGLLSSLERLNLRDNGIVGTIPSTIGGLTNLKELNLSGNDLTGSIPGQLVDLEQLTTLQLGSGFQGTVPEGICQLSGLTTIQIDDSSCSCCSIP